MKVIHLPKTCDVSLIVDQLREQGYDPIPGDTPHSIQLEELPPPHIRHKLRRVIKTKDKQRPWWVRLWNWIWS